MSAIEVDDLARRALKGATELERQLAIGILRNAAAVGFATVELAVPLQAVGRAYRRKVNARAGLGAITAVDEKFTALTTELAAADFELEGSVRKLLLAFGVADKVAAQAAAEIMAVIPPSGGG